MWEQLFYVFISEDKTAQGNARILLQEKREQCLSRLIMELVYDETGWGKQEVTACQSTEVTIIPIDVYARDNLPRPGPAAAAPDGTHRQYGNTNGTREPQPSLWPS